MFVAAVLHLLFYSRVFEKKNFLFTKEINLIKNIVKTIMPNQFKLSFYVILLHVGTYSGTKYRASQYPRAT